MYFITVSKTNLKIREHAIRGIWLDGVTERNVACVEEVLFILHEGQQNKHMAATSMLIKIYNLKLFKYIFKFEFLLKKYSTKKLCFFSFE